MKDSQPMGAEVPPFTQQNVDSPEKQPSQEEQPNDTDAAIAAGGLGVGQAATSNNHTPAALGQQCPAITPVGPSSILRRTDTNVTTNLAVRFEGEGEVADQSMHGKEVDNEGRAPNPYANVQQPTDTFARLRPSIDKSSSCWMEYTNKFL